MSRLHMLTSDANPHLAPAIRSSLVCHSLPRYPLGRYAYGSISSKRRLIVRSTQLTVWLHRTIVEEQGNLRF